MSLPPLQTGELHAERRRATILFADIQNSTELIRDLDPEAASHLLDPPIQIMLAAVTRYHGTVSHVLGDGVVAIFGAPTESEDHAVMACLAARAILEALDERHGGAIRARIGVHSGEVVFRHVQVGKSHSYDSIGAAVHIAARLEQTAEPGTACISATTHALAKGFINTGALAPASILPPIAGVCSPRRACPPSPAATRNWTGCATCASAAAMAWPGSCRSSARPASASRGCCTSSCRTAPRRARSFAWPAAR